MSDKKRDIEKHFLSLFSFTTSGWHNGRRIAIPKDKYRVRFLIVVSFTFLPFSFMGKVEIIERINNALKSFSKEGFTVPIHGEPQRYIIGLTDNKAKSIDFPLVKKLASQARALSKEFSDSLTI